ncbi:uncharacterized protein SPSK_10653 [Sporothrix schenckii 1099-18]|uniref:Uncharacterized protein n=1 Tax=Sporothrix schenckii 1099-18 TaxID=1397361 RepID=A0A0F2LWV6_SPOSC|nr:uncharacterized protein SPSK_10653 [Sporothrix schenckii 1099-18]KJR80970.1 hypothetical protein SPSK_10653 [Sporothrix schenckii 1099-18]
MSVHRAVWQDIADMDTAKADVLTTETAFLTKNTARFDALSLRAWRCCAKRSRNSARPRWVLELGPHALASSHHRTPQTRWTGFVDSSRQAVVRQHARAENENTGRCNAGGPGGWSEGHASQAGLQEAGERWHQMGSTK